QVHVFLHCPRKQLLFVGKFSHHIGLRRLVGQLVPSTCRVSLVRRRPFLYSPSSCTTHTAYFYHVISTTSRLGDFAVYQDSPISSELPTSRVQVQLFVQSPYTCLEEVVLFWLAPAPANQKQSIREGERYADQTKHRLLPRSLGRWFLLQQ